LVNQRATRDGDFIAKLPLQEIAHFSIYSRYKTLENLSPMAFGGIVYIEMMDPNYILPENHTLPLLLVQGMQIPLQYPVQNILTEKIPSTGSLLYWNPSITHDGTSAQFAIQTNDIAAEFLVEVVLHLSEPGQMEVFHQIVKVQP
jgi:hypothetical protein